MILRWMGKKISGLLSKKKKGAVSDKAIAGPEGVEAASPIEVITGDGAKSGPAALSEAPESLKISPDQAVKEYEQSLTDAEAMQQKMTDDAVARLKKPEIKTQKGAILAKHLIEESKRNPEGMAHLIRTWLAEE